MFLTNFLSILLAGGGVLALLGLSRAAMVEINGTARRNAFLVIIIGVLLVPLWITGSRITEDARTEGVTWSVATRWTAGTDYKVQQVSANRDNVAVIIVGRGTQPSFADLEARLKAALQRPVIVALEIVPVEKIVSQ